MSAQLASFLLYSLSPFHPNPDILENKDLLTELTKQYKVRLVLENQNLELELKGVGGSEEPSWSAASSSVSSSYLLRGDFQCAITQTLLTSGTFC